MVEKMYIFLLDRNNKIIEEIIIDKPETYVLLLKILKDNIKQLPKERSNFTLFHIFLNTDNKYNEIIIKGKEDYKTLEDTLLIRVNETCGNTQTPLSLDYSKLTEEKKNIIIGRYSCNICMKIIEEKPYFCQTCQQIYHENCLKDWEKKKKETNENFFCPFCRKELPLDQWKQKLFHLEYMNEDINLYKIYDLINLINERKIALLQNELQSKNEEINDIFLNILRKTSEISSLIKSLMDSRMIHLIKKYKELTEYILKFSKYRNEINLTYYAEENGPENIFGEKFVENNKNNIDLFINQTKSSLVSQCILKKGKNDIKIIIINDLNNLEYMFDGCKSLVNIEELKYLDTRRVTNFSYIFWGCSSLSDIKPIEQWEVSNGTNFSNIFSKQNLSDELKTFKNWKIALKKANCINRLSIINSYNSLIVDSTQDICASMIIKDNIKKLGVKSNF